MKEYIHAPKSARVYILLIIDLQRLLQLEQLGQQLVALLLPEPAGSDRRGHHRFRGPAPRGCVQAAAGGCGGAPANSLTEARGPIL